MSSPISIGRTATSPANAQHHGWGNKLKTIASHILLFLFPWVGVACGGKGDRLRVLIVGLLLALPLACGYCKCSIFRRQGHLFPLAGGQQDPELYCSLSQTVHLLVPLVVIGERLLLQSILKQQRNWPGGSCSHNMACHFYWMETVKNRKEMIRDWDKDGMESGWIQNEWKFRLNINSHL